MIVQTVKIKLHFLIISWVLWGLSFRCIHCTGQFTPKMKANAEPRLLSSLVWIDSGVVESQHRLESLFHEIECNGMTNFMEFMWSRRTPVSHLLGKTCESALDIMALAKQHYQSCSCDKHTALSVFQDSSWFCLNQNFRDNTMMS